MRSVIVTGECEGVKVMLYADTCGKEKHKYCWFQE